MVPDEIVRTVWINASPQRVWRVLTEADLVSQWFGDRTSIDLRPGGAMQLWWREHGTFHAVVDTVDEPKTFAYRWCLDADTPVADGASTLVMFTLTPDGDATRLTVTESGLADLPAGVREQRYRENTQGWDGGLPELVTFAERAA